MPRGLAAARRRGPTCAAAVNRPSDQSGPTSTTWPRRLSSATVAGGTRPSTTRKRGRVSLLEPEHLAARAEPETEFGNDRRGLQPAARRRRRDHVAGLVDDVEVHGVAGHVAHAAHGRLAGAEPADRGTLALLAA